MLLCLSSLLHAQVDSVYTGAPTSKGTDTSKKKKPVNEKWETAKKHMTFGGNFQAWFGNPTFLYISPTVGYMITPKLNAGLGFVYNYTSADYGYYGRYSQSVWGGHSFMRYLVTEGFFVQLQYDKLRQPDFITNYPETRKVWVDYVFVGGGFHQRLGDHAAFVTALMYNVTPSNLSIYYPNRLILQFGVTANL